jgi:hypothetical protein
MKKATIEVTYAFDPECGELNGACSLDYPSVAEI